MVTPFIESQVEAERLHRRIATLTEENRTLRDLAVPTAGPLELQAENILLQRETQMLQELLPHLVPFDGPLPESLEQFGDLPEPYRRQIAAENPEHIEALGQVAQLLRQAESQDRREADRVAALAGLPVDSVEQFAALNEDQRRELAFAMNSRQRRALCGDVGEAEDGAYL